MDKVLFYFISVIAIELWVIYAFVLTFDGNPSGLLCGLVAVCLMIFHAYMAIREWENEAEITFAYPFRKD